MVGLWWKVFRATRKGNKFTFKPQHAVARNKRGTPATIPLPEKCCPSKAGLKDPAAENPDVVKPTDDVISFPPYFREAR